MGAVDFGVNILKIDDKYVVKLGTTKSGHLTMSFRPGVLEPGPSQVIMLTNSEEQSLQQDDTIMAADALQEKLADKVLIRKMHLRLAHLNRGGLMRLLSAAGYHFEPEDVSDVIGKCSLLSQNTRVQKPILTHYFPQFCGHTVCSDICYPFGEVGQKQSKPHILCSCALSRYVVVKPIRRISPEHVADAFFTFWIMVFGRCHILLPDKVPGYTGKYMESFCESWSISHVTVPTSAPHSNGLIGRNVS